MYEIFIKEIDPDSRRKAGERYHVCCRAMLTEPLVIGVYDDRILAEDAIMNIVNSNNVSWYFDEKRHSWYCS